MANDGSIALFDPETLLAEISGEKPCGDDLEYDAEFLALMAAASSAPQERLVGPSGPAEEPNWRNIAKQAAALFARTKDVRVATVLARASLHLQGVDGLAQGVALVRALIERHWDAVHPLLDPSDGDPTMRLNALRELCDRHGVLTYLRAVPLLTMPGLGSFGFKELSVATGEAQPSPSKAAPDTAKLEAAFANCHLADIQAPIAALDRALADLREIENRVRGRVGAQRGLSFDELTGVLEQTRGLLNLRLAKRGAESEDAAASPTDDGSQPMMAAGGRKTRTVAVGDIMSRDDVKRVLEQLCAYYEQNEPSSPVPLLLRRAQRLAGMSFIEVMRDLAPGAAAEVEVIRGPQGTG
jgi:type VI secretion system protein ImpA